MIIILICLWEISLVLSIIQHKHDDADSASHFITTKGEGDRRSTLWWRPVADRMKPCQVFLCMCVSIEHPLISLWHKQSV